MRVVSETVTFRDHDTNSEAFASVRAAEGRVMIGFGVETNGDLDLVLDAADAGRLADALSRAAAEASAM